jgi:cob(I)alamin adenosyltransferase
MGTNTNLRKRIQSELDVIQEHLDKIRAELSNPNPDKYLIAKWEKDIARHQRALATYRSKLPGGKQ